MFFRAKTTPKWAIGLKDYQLVSINDVVNAHQPGFLPKDKDFEWNNTLLIVKSRMRRGENLDLIGLAKHPGCIHPQRRSAIAWRLIHKLAKSKISAKKP